MKKATKKSDFPKGEHYAILRFGSITQDGGHGYGEYTTDIVYYSFTESKDEWIKEVKEIERYAYNKEYVALHVKGQPIIQTKVTLDFGE